MEDASNEATALACALVQTEHKSSHRGRILIADHSLCLHRWADSLSGQTDLDVDVAVDGLIACHLAKASRTNGLPYDVVILDMEMPAMEGLESMRWLRRMQWTGPIVALGTYSSDSHSNTFLDAGCDDFIAKPLTDKKLHASLLRLAKQYDHVERLLPATGGVKNDPKPRYHGRLLLAEDAHCTQVLITGILEKMHLAVDLADNGEKACELAAQSQSAGNPYNVILMDMQMPKMNGKQATKWLRERGWQGTIIAVSIHASEQDHKEFIEAGCDTYLPKPVSEASLRHILAQYLTPA
jgi:CheY-like chemotaxis protein